MMPPHQAPAAWPRRTALFVAGLSVAAFAVYRDAWPWIADDAFISLRYADNLIEGHGLVWNPGERVEGYSNLLWVLLSAILLAAGCEPILALRVLAISASIATLATLAFSRLLPARLPAQLALLLLPTQAIFAFWAIGGLETPMVMLFVAWTMLGVSNAFTSDDSSPNRRWLLVAGVSLALLAWTRPDGPLWAVGAAASVAWLGRRARPLRLIVFLLWPPILAVLAQTLFRLTYYDEWIPNTGYAKMAPFSALLTFVWVAKCNDQVRAVA